MSQRLADTPQKRSQLRNRYTETDDRPDIVVFDTDNGKNIDLDISLAHPWHKDVIKLAAREQQKDEKTKRKLSTSRNCCLEGQHQI